MAVFPTLAAYGLYWWLLRRIGITALNALLFLVAPATASAGFFLLDEPLTALTLIGFALCGVGVAIVLAGEHRSSPTGALRSSTGPSGRIPRAEQGSKGCSSSIESERSVPDSDGTHRSPRC
jgi:hypothetical protein